MEKIYECSFNDSIKPISIRETEFIIEQMKTCVCKIHLGPKKGTGFFIKIPFRNQSMKVLMTNNHVLSENDILDGKIITITLNNELILKNIKMDSNRKRYTNEILDITIIEILGKDDINNYLTLDQQIKNRINLGKDDNSINTNFISNIYSNQSIYLLNYINNNTFEEIFISYGLLNKIDRKEIQHKCYTGKGSSGSPILLLQTKTVIGIHFGGTKLFNLGLFLLYPLLEFQNINNNMTVIKSNVCDDNALAIFDYNNIINKKVNKIYNDIKNYLFNERNIINILNNQFSQKQIYQSFLVDEKWVDKWKKYSNYEYIKKHYLEKNINDEKMIKNIINQNLVNNNLNYDELNDIEKYIIKDINQIKLPENMNKSYFLLNVNFLREFPIKFKITSIPFYLSYQRIQITSQNIPIISFQTNNNKIKNIINNNDYNSEFLKYLIKYVFFKKEFNIPTKLFKKNLTEAYIINSKAINKLKKAYDLNNLLLILDKNQILKGITLLNCDENYSKILRYINKYQINYINSIKKIEVEGTIKFTDDELSLKPKYLNNQINLKYFDGFDIIDIKLSTFLRYKFNYTTMFLVKFVEINNMFLLIIENEPYNYYQIIAFNSDSILSLKYLIEIVKNNLLKDNISLNNYIYNVLLKEGIEPLFYKGNPISLENNKIVFNLYDFSGENTYYDDTSSISNIHSGIQRKNLVTILFKTTSKRDIYIEVDENKNIEELIKLFFKKINKPELFGKDSIVFIYKACILDPCSKDSIKSLEINSENKIIIVDDLEN